jgi:hypothetical protein
VAYRRSDCLNNADLVRAVYRFAAVVETGAEPKIVTSMASAMAW